MAGLNVRAGCRVNTGGDHGRTAALEDYKESHLGTPAARSADGGAVLESAQGQRHASPHVGRFPASDGGWREGLLLFFKRTHPVASRALRRASQSEV